MFKFRSVACHQRKLYSLCFWGNSKTSLTFATLGILALLALCSEDAMLPLTAYSEWQKNSFLSKFDKLRFTRPTCWKRFSAQAVRCVDCHTKRRCVTPVSAVIGLGHSKSWTLDHYGGDQVSSSLPLPSQHRQNPP